MVAAAPSLKLYSPSYSSSLVADVVSRQAGRNINGNAAAAAMRLSSVVAAAPALTDKQTSVLEQAVHGWDVLLDLVH